MQTPHRPPHVISMPIVDDTFPRAFVDSAAPRRPHMGGAGGIIHLSSSRSIHFAVGLGVTSNNWAKFVVVNILLRLSLALGVDKLQVIGDSLLVVYCLKDHKPSMDIFLLPYFEDIDRARTHFTFLSFQHIFKEANAVVDGLSKKGVLLPVGFTDKWELSDGLMV